MKSRQRHMRKAVMSRMNENTELNPQKQNKGIICRFRFLFRNWDTRIMVYVMAIVTCIAIIAATVAWFTYYRIISARNMGLATADCESLKVALETGGQDIADLEAAGQSVIVDLNMPYFHNVESYASETGEVKSKLAPGVYGEITLYLTPLNQEINHYRITPAVLLTYNDGSCDQVDENGILIPSVEYDKEKLRNLVQGHILFYSERTLTTVEGKYVYSYSGQIMQNREGAMEDTLEFDLQHHTGIEKPVTIYWYWPYEYGDIPKETQEKIKLTEDSSSGGLDWDMFFYLENDDEVLPSSTDTVRLTQLYDYADTKIGTYVKSIKIQLKVDGYHK